MSKENITLKAVHLLGVSCSNSHMNRRDIRLLNARWLLKTKTNGVVDFGAKVGIETQSYASAIVGSNPTKGIGNKMARQIESAFGLPENWLDVPHGPIEGTGYLSVNESAVYYDTARSSDVGSTQNARPIAGKATTFPGGKVNIEASVGASTSEQLLVHSNDPDSYALKIVGCHLHPRIKHGEFILVEPGIKFNPGDEVVVRTHHDEVFIKEYVYEMDGMIRLDSANADGPSIYLDKEEIESIAIIGAITKGNRASSHTETISA